MPPLRLFALVTIAAAFQRTMRRMRRSISSSPGNQGSSSGGMVLMYGVDTSAGTPTCRLRARSASLPMTNRARDTPSVATSVSSDSNHSAVSLGSLSGSWCRKASKVIGGPQRTALRPNSHLGFRRPVCRLSALEAQRLVSTLHHEASRRVLEVVALEQAVGRRDDDVVDPEDRVHPGREELSLL